MTPISRRSSWGEWKFSLVAVSCTYWYYSVLHTYLVSCSGRLSSVQKKELSSYIQEQTVKTGGDQELADAWGMTSEEVHRFKKAVE